MHSMYLVAVPKGEATTERRAEIIAQNTLDEHGFAGEGSYFTSHKADWYQVGGRWCSFFTYANKWARDAQAEIEELVGRPENLVGGEKIEIIGVHYGQEEKTKKQKELRAQAELIWGKHRPKQYPKVMYDRHADDDGNTTWSTQGVSDCTQLATKELLDYIKERVDEWKKNEYYSPLEVFYTDECMEMPFDEEAYANLLEKYYLTIIDYHT